MPELTISPGETGVTSLALVIPTYNEAGNMVEVLERATRTLAPTGIAYELIVVDDDSADGTGERVREFAARDPRVKLIVRKDERGLASAAVRGWQSSSAGVLGVMDADLQHPPELVPELWARIQAGADVALASRYVPSASLGDWSLTRRVLSAIGIWATAAVLPREQRVSDPASGFFLVRRAAIAGVPLAAQGFKLLLEVLVRGEIARVDEVPFRFGSRQAGKSKGSANVVLDQVSLLWKLRRARAARAARVK